jgi:hypothetical protein
MRVCTCRWLARASPCENVYQAKRKERVPMLTHVSDGVGSELRMSVGVAVQLVTNSTVRNNTTMGHISYH